MDASADATALIPWELVGTITPPGLLSLVIIMILTGRLIPKATYDAAQRARDQWQRTAEMLRETNQVQAQTIEKQTSVGDTVIKVMSSLQKGGGEET
ncbi:hypothetical protein [Zhihengliuella halotolerans]|uniref:hypothetical protein n=1 Tax=Zhihengliuella halotolerans TaxID=370736 RepID=UPI000C80AE33|nr:hypothetical protein [Zhihengliuella halotolerans]